MSMWTGANTTPLIQLKRKDVTFKKCDGDSYEFNSVKARALYAKQKLGMGFTKLAKEFMESWLIVSEKFAPDENDPLFPFFSPEGEVYQYRTMSQSPQCLINRALIPMGYVSINTSIFRKTRSNALMRAFGDIFIVAKANKSSAETVSKSYLYGVKETHEIQLAGAFIAQGEITSGIPKKQAIEAALYKFKDPLTNFDWKLGTDHIG
ncbi:MAG: hypothetical protein HRT38_13145 [Alteromonadaceae bacterium]|nr:hypothetical protein [Alteromonadaceae bacterium]